MDPGQPQRPDLGGGFQLGHRAAAGGWARRPGWRSAVTGPLLAAYPGVLLSNTAVPGLAQLHRELPLLFAGGALTAAAAAGLVAGALSGDPADLGPAQRLALVGAAVESGAELAIERRSDVAAEPYHQGDAGRLLRYARAWARRPARWLALAARRSRAAAVASAALLTAGGIISKVAVLRAGVESARDPKYVVQTQTASARPVSGGRAANPRKFFSI